MIESTQFLLGFYWSILRKLKSRQTPRHLPSYLTIHSHLDHHSPLHHSCLRCPSHTCYELWGLRTSSEKQTLARNASFSCLGTLSHICTGSTHPFFSIFPSKYSVFFYFSLVFTQNIKEEGIFSSVGSPNSSLGKFHSSRLDLHNTSSYPKEDRPC